MEKTDFTDQFWKLIEMDMGCVVPPYLIYILRARGYDNAASVGSLTAGDIQQIEKYFEAKLESDINREKHRNAFYSDSDSFEILPGHVKLLEKIIAHVNSMTTAHGPRYFDPRFVRKAPNSDPIVGVVQASVCINSVEDRETVETHGSNVVPVDASISTPGGELVRKDGTLLLKALVESAERNGPRSKPGYRFDPLIKMFACFIKMISGLLAYETLHANLPFSLPSTSTVDKFMKDNGPVIVEGELRMDELVTYLKDRNLPLRVSLSEDATRITPLIQYDSKTNQLVGFALPLDKNGLPITSTFDASTAKQIQDHFNNPNNFVSSSVMVQMAQPQSETVPPFCLTLFLTDNKYRAENIMSRWNFTTQEAKLKGLIVDNFATDGDPRSLKVMIFKSNLGVQDLEYLNCEYYSCGGRCTTTYTQDSIHIGTKARNRILKVSRITPIGSKLVSVTHLNYLMDHISKLTGVTGTLSLPNYSHTGVDVDPKSRFAVVLNLNGEEDVVLKSAICWWLCRNKIKSSSDRMQRVMEKDYQPHLGGNATTSGLVKNDGIHIGEWCVFEQTGNLMIGMIISFCYTDGTTLKARSYTKTYADVNSSKAIGVLGKWYSWTKDGVLKAKPLGRKKHSFVPITCYKITVETPNYDGRIIIPPSVLEGLKKLSLISK